MCHLIPTLKDTRDITMISTENASGKLYKSLVFYKFLKILKIQESYTDFTLFPEHIRVKLNNNYSKAIISYEITITNNKCEINFT